MVLYKGLIIARKWWNENAYGFLYFEYFRAKNIKHQVQRNRGHLGWWKFHSPQQLILNWKKRYSSRETTWILFLCCQLFQKITAIKASCGCLYGNKNGTEINVFFHSLYNKDKWNMKRRNSFFENSSHKIWTPTTCFIHWSS